MEIYFSQNVSFFQDTEESQNQEVISAVHSRPLHDKVGRSKLPCNQCHSVLLEFLHGGHGATCVLSSIEEKSDFRKSNLFFSTVFHTILVHVGIFISS